jgi:putative tricarboxylic transport membrane protein
MRAKEEIAVAGILAVCGAAYYLAALQYPIGKIDSPGPGLMPRGLGIIFVVLSLYLLSEGLHALRSERSRAHAGTEEPGDAIKAPLGVTVILVLYALLLPVAGFSIATFLAVFCAGRLLGLEGWAKPVALAVGTTALCFLVFGWLLDVPLPAGVFGEGG